MKNKSADAPEYRTARWAIKVTPAEKRLGIERAHAANLTEADFIRAKVLDQSNAPSTRPQTVDTLALTRTLHVLGSLVDPLTRIADIMELGDQPLAAETQRAITSVVASSEAILRALGVAM